MQFFNPKSATISFGVSVLRGTMQVSMARTTDPNFTGRPEKGQKVYDWENTVYFSLNPSEVITLLDSWKAIMDGSYTNPQEKNEKFKHQFSITHFRQNQPSRFIVARSQDQQGNPTGSMMLTVLPPQGGGNPCSYVLRQSEYKQFRVYCENCARYLDFVKDIFDGIEKANRYNKNQENQNQQGGGQQQNQGDQNNQQYNNPYESTFDGGQQGGGQQQNQQQNNNPPPQNQGPPADQNVNNVGDMQFDW